MRLLFVGNFLSNQPGTFSVSEAIAQRLIDRGHQVILTSKKNNRFFRLVDMISTSFGMRKRFDVAHVDVFSGSAFFWAEATCLILKWLKKPVVMTLHGGNLPEFARRSSNRVRRLFASAASITVPSQYLHKKMQPYISRVSILPNPIDANHFQYRLRSSPKPELLWLRAFHEIYNPVLAVRVLEKLVFDFPQIHLTMVGRDKGDGSFQKVVEEARRGGCSEHLDLPGGVPNQTVPEWMDRADIFINTTNIDNTPVSVLEAMAAGMCIVSTNVGGIPYLLEHEHNALLVPPNDPDAMADVVKRLLTDPDLAQRLSQNARESVQQSDWGVVLPQWEYLFEGLDK